MPFFRPRPQALEAYRMPQPGKQPSDGLVFFLKAHGVLMGEGVAAPGDWVVADSRGKLFSCTPEDFDLFFESV